MNQQPGLHIVHNGLRRSCSEMGICQSCTPACQECDDPADTCPYCDPMTTFERGLMVFMAIASILVVAGGLGYLYIRLTA